MKNLSIKTTAFVAMTILVCFIYKSHAQDSIPQWMTNPPVQKGFIFGAGVGKSSDLSNANDKARMNALNDLTYNYNGKFETFAVSCDSVLGADNKMREVVTSFKMKQHATLKGTETDKKAVDIKDEVTVVYLLLKLDVSNEVKTLQKEVDANAGLRKKMEKSGLLLKLKGL
jgi:hypothetical protein